MPTIVVQIGMSTGYKERQSVKAYLNDQEVRWVRSGSDYNGHFVTPPSSRQSKTWFLAKLECSSGDVVRIKSEVFIRGMGFDEDRSQTSEWLVNDDAQPENFEIRKVGAPGFPLLSGKVSLIQSRAMIEDRIDQGENLIRESQE